MTLIDCQSAHATRRGERHANPAHCAEFPSGTHRAQSIRKSADHRLRCNGKDACDAPYLARVDIAKTEKHGTMPPTPFYMDYLVDIDFFRHFLDKQIKKEFGESSSFATHEYVHHRKYRRDRVGNRILGTGPEGVSRLHEVVHRLLTDDERREVFPSTFDLGNFRDVPQEFRKYVHLEKELYDENNSIDAQDTLKTIKTRLTTLLDRKFGEFFEEDKSKSLKVLKTLYRFQREYKTLFTLLAPPQKSGKPSFEIRDSYGVEGSSEEVDLIADLKAHLSFEIPPEKLKVIMSTYGQMRGVLDGIEDFLVTTAAAQCRNDKEIHRVIAQHIVECIRETLHFPDREPEILPLDEHLFTYMLQLEHYHHMQAHADLNDIVVSIEPPFGEAMEDIETLMCNLSLGNQSPQLILLETNDFEIFFQEHQPSLTYFYSRLFKRKIEDVFYQKAIPHAVKLSQLLARAGLDEDICLMAVIGAMALVLTEQTKSSPYKPFWYGRKHISGGLIEFLNKVDLQHINFDASEGSLRYWTTRSNYLAYTILGQQEVFKSRLLITECINEGITRILDTRDIDLLNEKLSLFVSTTGGTAP